MLHHWDSPDPRMDLILQKLLYFGFLFFKQPYLEAYIHPIVVHAKVRSWLENVRISTIQAVTVSCLPHSSHCISRASRGGLSHAGRKSAQ